MVKPFTKPPISIEDQVSLLIQRGLFIKEKETVKDFIEKHSYYRLSGYFKPFMVSGSEKFLHNTSFEEIMSYYTVDSKLRGIIFKASEAIEIAIRAALSHEMCMRSEDAFWYTDQKYFKSDFDHPKMLEKIQQAVLENKNQPFIKHFNSNYQDKYLPSWVISEILSFGSISRIYRSLTNSHQRIIANKFQIGSSHICQSWIHSLSVLRNECAHHHRLWNKKVSIKPYETTEMKNKKCMPDFFSGRFFVLNHFYQAITSQCLLNDFHTIVSEYTDLDIKGYGFH